MRRQFFDADILTLCCKDSRTMRISYSYVLVLLVYFFVRIVAMPSPVITYLTTSNTPPAANVADLQGDDVDSFVPVSTTKSQFDSLGNGTSLSGGASQPDDSSISRAGEATDLLLTGAYQLDSVAPTFPLQLPLTSRRCSRRFTRMY